MAMRLNDFRYATRTLRLSLGFSIMAVCTLALAIGANTAIFSLVRAVLLDSLPYPDAPRLFTLWEDASHIDFPFNTPAPGNYSEWKAQNTVFEGMAALRSGSYNLTGTGHPDRLTGQQVTSDFFSVLGVAPSMGRTFIAEEDRPGFANVVVISAGLWRTHFGADPAVVGRTILLDEAPYTIVGVMPAGFDFPEIGTQIWTPIAFTVEDLQNRGSHVLQVVARLKPDITVEQATQEMAEIARRLQEEYPETNANVGIRMVPLRDQLVADAGIAALLLLGISGCVLLIASANLANLLLVRAVTRQPDIGVRIALGAGRRQVMQLVLAESLILSGAGAILGIAVARASFSFLSVLLPENLTTARLVLDGRMLLFALALTVFVTILFGVVPALQTWRLGVAETLRRGGPRSGQHHSTHRLRRWVVVFQTAFTFILLVATGLMLRTFMELGAVDPGFQGQNVLTVRTALPRPRYDSLERRTAFYSEALDRVRALPGVVESGFTSWLPFTQLGGASWFAIEGRPDPPPGREFDANIRLVTSGYLPAMGATLVSGRNLTPMDRAGAEAVAVINQTMAARFWPGENALNQRVRICSECPWFRVVGIVADFHQWTLHTAPRPEYFMPFDQLPIAFSWAPPQDLAIQVAGDAAAMAPAIQAAIWEIDPQQPVTRIKVLADYVNEDLAPRRFQTQLMGGFAALALLLSGLGIYGVLSYAVTQRRREIGLRMALGANPSRVARLVTVQGLRPVITGLTAGAVFAYGLAQFVGYYYPEGAADLLYGVTPRDSLTFVSAAAVLLVTALLASWIPARRAGRVDPGTVLHYD